MDFAARIADGLVVEIVELPLRVEIGTDGEPVTLTERVPLSELFHPDVGFVPAPDTARIGMRYEEGVFLPPPPPPPIILEPAPEGA